ncbi:nitroreductase family protein [Furfurilactobacillus sp. WILCCON 0119]|uniref:nitroreductase family protein n=1 Tax=Furfurilactobacillus entadae TaxID=2922307 RepID=UPI0035ED7A70
MKTDLLDLMKQRRSVYNLGKDVKLSQDELTTIVQDIVKEAPSAFNSQTTRVVFAYGESHNKVWQIVEDTLEKIVPADQFEGTKAKIENSFKAGYGTLLWFTEMDTVANLAEQYPAIGESFGDWSEQHVGNAQFAVWTALAENGVGASIQHYNPLIDDAIKEAFNIPASWRLRSEMPFGSVETMPEDKDYMATDDRFKIFN